MSKRPSDNTGKDSKKIKHSDSVSSTNLDNNTDRQSSNTNIESSTSDQSNTTTLPRRIRTQRQSSGDFCLCYTPFRCPNPECGYTDVPISELNDSEESREILDEMLESVRSNKE